jgi:hypothetical protein
MTGSNQPPGAFADGSTAARVGGLGIALLRGGCIAGFGSLSSIKLGLCAGSIYDPVKDAS